MKKIKLSINVSNSNKKEEENMMNEGYKCFHCQENTVAYDNDFSMYMKDGVKIHVRQMKSIICKDYKNETRKTVRPTFEQMQELNIQHYKGKQYRYLKFLCSKTEKKRLLRECLIDLSLPNPKDSDLQWTIKNQNNKWVKSNKPPYITDIDKKTKDIVNID